MNEYVCSRSRRGPAFALWTAALLLVTPSLATAQDVADELAGLIYPVPAPLQSEGFFALRILPFAPTFGVVVLGLLALMLVHLLWFGSNDLRGAAGEQELRWYNAFDRVMHAVVGITFLVLMFTGLSITFGRILPTFGLGLELRMIHDLAGWVFAPFFVVMAARMLRNALFHNFDWDWLRHAGGYLGYKGHLPAGKFNAGQKAWYWVMVACGLVLMGTGFALYFKWGGTELLRTWVFLHVVSMVPIVLFFLVHVYLSLVANRGVWRSMVTGRVPLSVVESHHEHAGALKQWKEQHAA